MSMRATVRMRAARSHARLGALRRGAPSTPCTAQACSGQPGSVMRAGPPSGNHNAAVGPPHEGQRGDHLRGCLGVPPPIGVQTDMDFSSNYDDQRRRCVTRSGARGRDRKTVGLRSSLFIAAKALAACLCSVLRSFQLSPLEEPDKGLTHKAAMQQAAPALRLLQQAAVAAGERPEPLPRRWKAPGRWKAPRSAVVIWEALSTHFEGLSCSVLCRV